MQRRREWRPRVDEDCRRKTGCLRACPVFRAHTHRTDLQMAARRDGGADDTSVGDVIIWRRELNYYCVVYTTKHVETSTIILENSCVFVCAFRFRFESLCGRCVVCVYRICYYYSFRHFSRPRNDDDDVDEQLPAAAPSSGHTYRTAAAPPYIHYSKHVTDICFLRNDTRRARLLHSPAVGLSARVL